MRRRSLRKRATSIVSAIRAAQAALVLTLAAGCAQLIGAEFEDAKLGDDGGAFDATAFDEGGSPDVSAESSIPIDGSDAAGEFDAGVAGDGGILLWLAADRGIVDGGPADDAAPGAPLTVAGWSDQSGLKHDLVAASGPQRPLVVTLDSGLPVVRLERARLTYFMSPAWNGPAGERGTTIFFVARGQHESLVRFQGPSNPNDHLLYPWNARNGTPQEPPDYQFFVSSVGDRQRIRTGTVAGEWNLGTAVLELGVLGGMRAYRNGQLVEQASLFTDAMPATDTLTFGCSYLATECADADVAEILIYGSPLDDAARGYVEAYLKKKWGLGP